MNDPTTQANALRTGRRLISLPVLAAVLLFGAAPGWATTYDCRLKSFSKFGGVPGRLILSIDEASGEGAAYDSAIHYIHGKPIPVETREISDGKYAMSWDLKGLSASGNSTIATTSIVRLDTRRMKVSFLGYVKGYFNENKGAGKCRLAK